MFRAAQHQRQLVHLYAAVCAAQDALVIRCASLQESVDRLGQEVARVSSSEMQIQMHSDGADPAESVAAEYMDEGQGPRQGFQTDQKDEANVIPTKMFAGLVQQREVERPEVAAVR